MSLSITFCNRLMNLAYPHMQYFQRRVFKDVLGLTLFFTACNENWLRMMTKYLKFLSKIPMISKQYISNSNQCEVKKSSQVDYFHFNVNISRLTPHQHWLSVWVRFMLWYSWTDPVNIHIDPHSEILNYLSALSRELIHYTNYFRSSGTALTLYLDPFL